MNIFLTGVSGFVGKNIFSQLSQKYNIFAPGSSELDLTDLKKLESYISKHNFQYIINCAVRGGRRTKEDSEKDFYNNIKILDNLLNYVDQNRKLITFSSGAEVYNPESFYGFSKKISTALIKDKFNIKNLRIYNVFGSSGMQDSFVYSVIEKCLKNEDIIIWDDKFFDICYIDDLIKLIDNLIIENSISYQEIDCVYSKKYKLSDIASLIKSLTNSQSSIVIEKDTGSKYIGIYNKEFKDLTPLSISIETMISEIKADYV